MLKLLVFLGYWGRNLGIERTLSLKRETPIKNGNAKQLTSNPACVCLCPCLQLADEKATKPQDNHKAAGETTPLRSTCIKDFGE